MGHCPFPQAFDLAFHGAIQMCCPRCCFGGGSGFQRAIWLKLLALRSCPCPCLPKAIWHDQPIGCLHTGAKDELEEPCGAKVLRLCEPDGSSILLKIRIL